MIRCARREDIPFMVDLLHLLFTIETDFTFDCSLQTKGLQLLLDSSTATVAVAEKQEVVVGMAIAQLMVSTAVGAPSLLVEDVVVEPSWQNQGIGTELLDYLCSWAEENGARRMQLLADSTNIRAIDYYLGKGWQKTRMICLHNYLSPQQQK